MKRLCFIFICFLITISFGSILIAHQKETSDIKKIFNLSLEELMNVKITTAGKTEQKISDIPASIVLVSREDIERQGYQTLDEILQNIPGLYQVNDLYLKTFGVRGFWTQDPNKNLTILVNDVPQREDLYLSSALENMNIPVEAIDRIEVVRGPMSVIYGNGAFFGVINIKTNLLQKDETLNIVSSSMGSEKTIKLFVRTSGKEGNLKYSFNAAIRDTAGIDHAYSDMMTDPAAFGIFKTLSTKNHLDSTEKYFNFSGKFNGFFLDLSYSDSTRGFNLFLPSITGSESFLRMTRISFGYIFNISKKIKMNTSFNYHHYRRGVSKYDWGSWGLQDDGSTAYEIAIDIFYHPSPKLNITSGISYYNAFDVLNSFSVPLFDLVNARFLPGEPKTIAFFTQFDYRFSDKFKLVAGLRLENYSSLQLSGVYSGGLPDEQVLNARIEQTGITIVPRLALIYSISPKNVLKFLYGKAINRPSPLQYGDNLSSGASYVLDPEEIQTFEINYISQLSSKFSLSLNIFRNMLDKLIFNTTFLIDDVYTTYYSNVGKMNTTGLELTLQARLSNRFSFDISGTYQNTKDEREGFEKIEPGYSPKYLGYFKASYSVNQNTSIALNANYVDKMYSYYDSTIPGRVGKETAESYILLGANLRIKNFYWNGLFLNIRCSNLLNSKVFFPSTNWSTYADKGTIGRKRTFLLTIGWKF